MAPKAAPSELLTAPPMVMIAESRLFAMPQFFGKPSIHHRKRLVGIARISCSPHPVKLARASAPLRMYSGASR
jgi:hypothetical protein